MKLNLIYNKFIPNYQNSLEVIEKELISYNIDFKTQELSGMENYGDFTFVIGGDGTLLRCAKYYSEYETPVMGINTGRLGFLSQSGTDEIKSVIEAVLENRYGVQNRMMLKSNEYKALNDFVIKGCISGRTSGFYLEINNKFVCDYVADGIIISTPTGSTAYGLSAGGPVLSPDMDAIVIVPICPHTLNARPIVVPSGETISVKTSDELLSVCIDGFVTTKCVDKVVIKKYEKKAKLAFLDNNNFYTVLRDKLHWGISPEK